MAGILDTIQTGSQNLINLGGSLLEGAYGEDKLSDLAADYAAQGFRLTAPEASTARHIAGINELSKSIAAPISKISQPLGTFAGDLGSFGIGLWNEALALPRGVGPGYENLSEIWQDVKDNWTGSFGTPNITTSEDIYSQVYGIPTRLKQRQLMNQRKQNMQQRIRQGEAAEAAKQKAAADAKQASLQAQVTAQANREAKQRVSRGEARDYGKTETRASSGWESSPFEKGGLVNFYRYGGFI